MERFPNDIERLNLVQPIEPNIQKLLSQDEVADVYLKVSQDKAKSGKTLVVDGGIFKTEEN